MPLEGKKRFIEDFGLLFEGCGMPRMAGRIFGWLLICDPPHQSAKELSKITGASKGSISSMTHLLIQRQVIERVGLPGNRSTYYRLRFGSWREVLRSRMSFITAFRKLTEQGLVLIKNEKPQVKERLQQICDLYTFFEKEIPAVLDRFDKECQTKKRGKNATK